MKRGMGLYSESHESGRALIGDGMSVKRRATVPMGAMWTQTPGVNKEQFGYDADIRESASVAHIYGQNVVAAESMTAASGAWAWAPETLKPTADQEMAMGLNRFVIHTSVHQPLIDKAPGLALGPFGQWFTRNETWAELAGPWIRYLARSSYLLQQGRFVADIGYFYGEDSNVTALFAAAAPDVPAGYNFDFINADTLLTALRASDGAITTPSGMAYRVLALDPNAQHMSLPVLRALSALVSSGAVVVGERPLATPSLADDSREFSRLVAELWGPSDGRHAYGKGAVYSGQRLDEVLTTLGIAPDFQVEKASSGADVLFVHRRLPAADVYYVDNRLNRREQVEVSFRVAGKAPELWHADSGTREPVSYRMTGGRTQLPLDLQPHQTVFVVFRHPTATTERNIGALVETPLTILAAPWEISFQPPSGRAHGAPSDNADVVERGGDPGIKYFSGTAAYSTTLQAAPAWFAPGARLWLDLGKVMNLAEVRVNGKDLGIAWKSPFRVDVTSALRPGVNRLQVKVTNLWVNRLIGDQQPGAQEKLHPHHAGILPANAPLLPSGLLGPVRVIRETRAGALGDADDSFQSMFASLTAAVRAPFAGEVLVKDNRIAAVARSAGGESLPRDNVMVVDGAGATLMPGMTEAHAHLSWPSSVERFVPGMSLPPEDLLLNTARNARILLDHGFTSAYSAGALGKTLEMSLKAQIDSGGMPGPRLVPSSLEREPPNETAYLQGGKRRRARQGPRRGARLHQGLRGQRRQSRQVSALRRKCLEARRFPANSVHRGGGSRRRRAGARVQRVADGPRARGGGNKNGHAQRFSRSVSLHLRRCRSHRHVGGAQE